MNADAKPFPVPGALPVRRAGDASGLIDEVAGDVDTDHGFWPLISRCP